MGRNLNISFPWRVAGASVTGISHQKAGKECEDAWALSQAVRPDSQEAVAAACVSDGAGSVSRAFAGAKLTAFGVSDWLCERFQLALTLSQDQIGQLCLAKVRRLVRRAATRARRSPEEYAATLVAVCVGSDGAWLALHLGDGGIVGKFGNEVSVVSPPEKGEFANETWFVTSPDALEHLRVYGSPFNPDLRKPTGFVIFSDGAEKSLLDSRNAIVAKAASIMLGWLRDRPPATVSGAIEQNVKTVFHEQSRDDCTIVLMARPDESQPDCLDIHYE